MKPVFPSWRLVFAISRKTGWAIINDRVPSRHRWYANNDFCYRSNRANPLLTDGNRPSSGCDRSATVSRINRPVSCGVHGFLVKRKSQVLLGSLAVGYDVQTNRTSSCRSFLPRCCSVTVEFLPFSS